MATRPATLADVLTGYGYALYDASDGSTLLDASGNPIALGSGAAQWLDKSVSSGGRTGQTYPGSQNSPAAQPILSGSGWTPTGGQALSVKGSQLLTLTPALPLYSGAAGMTILAAVSAPPDGGYYSLISGSDVGAPELKWYNNKVQVTRAYQQDLVASEATVTTGFHLIGMDASTNLAVAYLNGVGTPQAIDPAFSTANDQLFQNTGNYSGDSFNGLVGAILHVFSAVLPTAVRQKAEGVIAWALGLQNQLPANHPCRAAAPTVTTGGTATIRRRPVLVM